MYHEARAACATLVLFSRTIRTKEAFVLKLHTYHTPRSLALPLREEASCGDTIFLVPSNRDRPILHDMLFSAGGEHLLISFPERKPKVWIWDDLYRALAEAMDARVRVQIDPPDHWLLVRHLVLRLRGQYEDRLPAGTASPRFLNLAGQSIRELLAEDVPLSELAASLGCPGCVPGEACGSLGDESGLLCRLYGDYTAILEELRLADSAQIPSLGAKLLETFPKAGNAWAGTLRIRAAGFLSFASGQMRFLRALEAAGADLELWVPECGDGDYYTAVQQFPEAELERIPEDGRGIPLASIAAGDRRLSTDTLARELFLWPSGEGYLGKEADFPFPGWENIAICAEQDDLESLLESFQRYGLPFSLREGTLVSETILWKSALRALDLAANNWPSVETADFLSSILYAPFDFPREAFSERLPSGQRSWNAFLESFPPEAGADGFRRALRFSERIAKGGRPEELLAALADLAPSRDGLKRLAQKAKPHPGVDDEIREISLSIQEAKEKEETLHELRRNLGEAGENPLRGEEAVAFLAQWAETASIWMPAPVSPAITIHPGTPPALVSSSIWIFPGVTAKRWPGQVRESPLLSDERKEYLHDTLGLGRSHLPLVPEKRSQREALFRRLTACGENLCILLRPLADEAGRPIPESPFVKDACNPLRPWLSPCEKEYPKRSLGDILLAEECPVALGTEIHRYAGPPEGLDRGLLADIELPLPKNRSFSLSDLDTYVSCPFLYYCRRTASLDTPREELYRLDLAGSAIHLLWQEAWMRRLQEGKSLESLVHELFEKALEQKYSRLKDDKALSREKKDLLRKAVRLARFQQEMEEKGLAGARKEQRREYALPEFERSGVLFKGRADRIDFLKDGRAAIFDYKSGPTDGYKESLQLAAYGIALKSEGVLTVASAYLCLGDGKARGASLNDAPSVLSFKTPLEELGEKAEEALARVVHSFKTGLFPPEYESKSCRWCEYSSLCRRRDFRDAESEEEGEENAGQ